MKTTYINITAAIRHYNASCKECDKMTQEKLATIVFPEVSPSTARRILSNWNNGDFSNRKVKKGDLVKIAKLTRFPLSKLKSVY